MNMSMIYACVAFPRPLPGSWLLLAGACVMCAGASAGAYDSYENKTKRYKRKSKIRPEGHAEAPPRISSQQSAQLASLLLPPQNSKRTDA